MAKCGTPPPTTIEVLSEADVLEALQRLMAFGFGRLEITVSKHYIHTIHQSYTRLGKQPLPTT